MEVLKDQVSEAQIEVVTLQQLREALGYKKLGPRVLSDVSQKLAGQGLGYFPRYVIDDNDLPRAWRRSASTSRIPRWGRSFRLSWTPTETGTSTSSKRAEATTRRPRFLTGSARCWASSP